MKRRELEGYLRDHGCEFLREESAHSIWINPRTGHKEAIPRHNEIKRHLARKTCRSLSVEVPKGA